MKIVKSVFIRCYIFDPYKQSMYITSVTIENIRSIKKIKIKFDKLGESTLLTGNNGCGKSTILRSIAMGITDEDSAASVLREMPGEIVRKGQDHGVITVELSQRNGRKFKILTKIVSQESFEKVFQRVYSFENNRYKSIDQEDFPWHTIFTTGYGAGVRNLGNADYQYYVSIDALYSLFKSDVALQNPELAIRRVIARAKESGVKNAEKKMENYLTDTLKNILNLESDGKVILTSSSIQVKSKEWGRNELSTLGDGYISTITWILDLFGWWLLHLKLRHKNIIKNKEIKGIVLIDEIEQHLHPIWQINIMRLLKESFPKVQFISTTHSPLVISGKIDMNVSIVSPQGITSTKASGWLAEDVYREIMGLPSSRSELANKLIEDYKRLHFKYLHNKSSKKERASMRKIKNQLINVLPNNDIIVETAELNNLTKILKLGESEER